MKNVCAFANQKDLHVMKNVCANQKIFANLEKCSRIWKMLAQHEKVRSRLPEIVCANRKSFAPPRKCSHIRRNAGAIQKSAAHPRGRRCAPLQKKALLTVLPGIFPGFSSAPAGSSSPLKVLLVPPPSEMLLVPRSVAKSWTSS
jgi:hypothetical protein